MPIETFNEKFDSLVYCVMGRVIINPVSSNTYLFYVFSG